MRVFSGALIHAMDYLKKKNVYYNGYEYSELNGILEVRFRAGTGRALINIASDSPKEIEGIIDSCINTYENFNIENHEFSLIENKANMGCMGYLNYTDGIDNTMKINKKDAIAIARALGVTGEDLIAAN